ncbi:hypothetical protein R1flu_007592 [Riccia fluitans]|uniref:Uncharacterized protein n=1 Tax=Riccia fluitans TaxID=41844 RepID=A0ABD1Z052_9MARC
MERSSHAQIMKPRGGAKGPDHRAVRQILNGIQSPREDRESYREQNPTNSPTNRHPPHLQIIIRQEKSVRSTVGAQSDLQSPIEPSVPCIQFTSVKKCSNSSREIPAAEACPVRSRSGDRASGFRAIFPVDLKTRREDLKPAAAIVPEDPIRSRHLFQRGFADLASSGNLPPQHDLGYESQARSDKFRGLAMYLSRPCSTVVGHRQGQANCNAFTTAMLLLVERIIGCHPIRSRPYTEPCGLPPRRRAPPRTCRSQPGNAYVAPSPVCPRVARLASRHTPERQPRCCRGLEVVLQEKYTPYPVPRDARRPLSRVGPVDYCLVVFTPIHVALD